MDIRTTNASVTSSAPAMYGLRNVASAMGMTGPRIAFEPETGSGGAVPDTPAAEPAAATEGVTTEPKTAEKPVEQPKTAEPDAAPADKPQVSDEVAKLLKDVMKHKEKAKAAEGQATEASSKLSALQEKIKQIFGVEGLEDIEKALEQAAQDEEAKLKAAGKFDELKDRMVAEHQKALNKIQGETNQKVGDLNAKLESAEGEIRRLLVSNSFAASGFIAEELNLTPHHAERLFGDSFKVEEKDGRRVVVAYRGNEPLVDANGSPLSFDQALKELVEADQGKEALYKPKAKPGAGSGVQGKEATVPQADTLRGQSRIAAALNQKK